jgi:putative Holliday junction resolvase
MGRILAIDYGLKRTGLAVTDPLKIIANSLDAVATHDLVKYLENYFLKEEVERVVIGLPKNLNNEPTHTTKPVEDFVQLFKKKFKIPIETHDERFTTKIAFQSMIQSGVSKKDRRNKGLIDQVSATVILQSYLESMN